MNLLEKKAKNAPDSPGVYKMLDKENRVIYVGKAKNLKKRVQAYFRSNYQHSTRTRKLLETASDIKFIETDSELEALLLENNLIKELRPKYNILMKDDKSYVYIKVNLDEDFPRIRVVRERTINKTGEGSKAKYFGPKLATSKVYETLRTLKKLFPFRHCGLEIKWECQMSNVKCQMLDSLLQISPNKNLVEIGNQTIDFPCLDYFIKRCPGPCLGAISPIAYKKIVQQILDFLSGKSEELEKSLKQQMAEAASQKLFEKAARLRDKIFAMQSITERQKITDTERRDTDVINFAVENSRAYFNIFMIREGKLINQENFAMDAHEIKQNDLSDAAEILESFISQYYEKAADIPLEILAPAELKNKDTLEKWLSEKKNKRTIIIHPQKGTKNKLLELSLKNALSFAKQYRLKWMTQEKLKNALPRLAELLGIKDKQLKRIEGFDISHIGGEETVGSMVVFENGAAKPSYYRHFKIRTVKGKPDDYKCMEEILMRRLKYLSGANADKMIKIKTPSKKDFEEIKKIIKNENISNKKLLKKEFLAAKSGEKLLGFGRIMKLDEKVSIISSLWVDPEKRGQRLGYKIMEKLIVRSKLKRIYIDTNKKIEEYFSVFGFTVLREPPQILIKHARALDEKLKKEGRKIPLTEELIYMAFDVAKHKKDPSFAAKPALLVIDGGKGQMGTALLVLKRLKLKIPIVALAKQLEEIYLPSEKAPILLEQGDEALKLLQRIRDESHRFAITFHRNLHRKSLLLGARGGT